MPFVQTLNDIEFIKDRFQELLKQGLNLIRISAPLFLEKDSGLNDDLNGTEEKVTFEFNGKTLEIVQSLAKWKRVALKKYNIDGLYADMNAIRKDEKIDELHSIYVDQWDWEMIAPESNPQNFMISIVKSIHELIYTLERDYIKYKQLPFTYNEVIPKEIFFISSEDLLKQYPSLSPKEREYEITKIHKAVCITQIGKMLSDGSIHDSRASDYDNWNINCDLLYWSDEINKPIEISSMGYRVNSKSLLEQLKKAGELYKLENSYCRMIMNNELPQTIGGGIGQSRLCMLIMKRKHIAEVQCSIWGKDIENAL